MSFTAGIWNNMKGKDVSRYLWEGNTLQVGKTRLGLLHALSEETCSSFHTSPEVCFRAALESWEEATCLSKQKRCNETPWCKDAQADQIHFTGWHHFCTSCRNPDSRERSHIPGFFEVNKVSVTLRCDCVQMRDLPLWCNTLYFCSNVVHMETFQAKKEEEEEKEKEEEEEEDKKEKQQQLLLLAMRCQYCSQAASQAALACQCLRST